MSPSRKAPAFPPTRLEDVFGCLPWDGPELSIAEMDAAVLAEAAERARDSETVASADAGRARSRRVFGACKGAFEVGPEFYEPLSDDDLDDLGMP